MMDACAPSMILPSGSMLLAPSTGKAASEKRCLATSGPKSYSWLPMAMAVRPTWLSRSIMCAPLVDGGHQRRRDGVAGEGHQHVGAARPLGPDHRGQARDAALPAAFLHPVQVVEMNDGKLHRLGETQAARHDDNDKRQDRPDQRDPQRRILHGAPLPFLSRDSTASLGPRYEKTKQRSIRRVAGYVGEPGLWRRPRAAARRPALQFVEGPGFVPAPAEDQLAFP